MEANLERRSIRSTQQRDEIRVHLIVGGASGKSQVDLLQTGRKFLDLLHVNLLIRRGCRRNFLRHQHADPCLRCGQRTFAPRREQLRQVLTINAQVGIEITARVRWNRSPVANHDS